MYESKIIKLVKNPITFFLLFYVYLILTTRNYFHVFDIKKIGEIYVCIPNDESTQFGYYKY